MSAEINEEKNEVDLLVHKVGSVALADDRLIPDWDSLAITAILRDHSGSVNWFTYQGEARPRPGSPSDGQLHDTFRELRDAMNKRDGGQHWKACLVKIKKIDMSIQIEFEYENENRWKVTPATVKTLPE